MSEDTSTAPRYYAVFGVLLVLLALTVGAALVDWGALNIILSLGIAAAKIALIAVYFMHLKGSRTTVQAFSIAGIAWLAMMLVLLLSDYFTRASSGG